jgi:hypothetical protein
LKFFVDMPVTPQAVAHLEARGHDAIHASAVGFGGEVSILRPTPPVRRYADLVRQLVHSLCLAGFPGDRSVAQVLARALPARVFLREPSGPDMSRLLKRAARRLGPPRHSVSDRGTQFTSRVFRRMAARLGIRHRYGAIGRTGSIALIERFFRTLKALGGFRDRPSLLLSDLERRLAVALDYYIRQRPHQGLGGAVPGERLRGLRPSHLESIPPPRGRPGERVSDVPMFEIRYADPEQRLPYLVRRAA